MDDGVILQPDDSQKNDPAPTDLKVTEPGIGVAKNAPGFEEDQGSNEDRVFEITKDLNISPINEDTATPAMPIDTIVVPVAPKILKVKSEPVITPTLPTKPGTEPDLIQPPPVPGKLPGVAPKPNGPGTAAAETPAPVMRHLDPNLPHDPNLKPLRTYESDVAQALAREHTSVTTMAVAENQKRQQQQAKAEEPEEEPMQGTSKAKKLLLFLLSLCFIGAGVIGAYYLYSKSPLAPPIPVTGGPTDKPKIVSLIPSDSYVLMPTDNLNTVSLKTRVRREMDKSQTEGSIMEIVPTKIVDGQTMRVSAEGMIDIMDVEVPDILLRSLGQPAMIGIYTPLRDSRSIFAVVTTEFFQNTFAGMLQWESLMADDLKFYLFPDTVQGVANTTDRRAPTPAQTGTSTTPADPETVAPLLTIRGTFVDRIIKNKDVREFVADDGRVLFLYSFVDNNKLVITDDEATLAEILTRLEKAASIR